MTIATTAARNAIHWRKQAKINRAYNNSAQARHCEKQEAHCMRVMQRTSGRQLFDFDGYGPVCPGDTRLIVRGIINRMIAKGFVCPNGRQVAVRLLREDLPELSEDDAEVAIHLQWPQGDPL